MPVRTAGNWDRLRIRVLERDGHRCAVCFRSFRSGLTYECGHILDRASGGADRIDNLVAMCHWCNAGKPLHATKEEAEAWIEAGGVIGQFVSFIEREGADPKNAAVMRKVVASFTRQRMADTLELLGQIAEAGGPRSVLPPHVQLSIDYYLREYRTDEAYVDPDVDGYEANLISFLLMLKPEVRDAYLGTTFHQEES